MNLSFNVTWGISSFILSCTTFVSAYSLMCYGRYRAAKLKKRHSPFFQRVYHLMVLRSLHSRTVVKIHDTQGSYVCVVFFFLIKLYWKATIIFYLCSVCDCLCILVVELGSCDRGWSAKTKIFTIWPFKTKFANFWPRIGNVLELPQ